MHFAWKKNNRKKRQLRHFLTTCCCYTSIRPKLNLYYFFFLAMGNDCLERSGVGPVGRDPVQHPGPPPPLHQPWLELQPGDCPQARRNILRSRSHRAHLLPEAAGRCGRGLSGSCPPRLEQHRPRKNASQPSNLIRSPAGNYFVILYIVK